MMNLKNGGLSKFTLGSDRAKFILIMATAIVFFAGSLVEPVLGSSPQRNVKNKEILEKRTLTSRTYDDGAGTYTAVIRASSVFTKGIIIQANSGQLDQTYCCRIEDGTTKTASSLYIGNYSGNYRRSCSKFDVSSIPDGSDITKIKFVCRSNATNGAVMLYVTEMDNDPESADASTLWSDIEGITYASQNITTNDTWTFNDLGASAHTKLESMLTSDWFALGMYPGASPTAWVGFSTGTHFIEITYTPHVPPTVTTDNATSIDETSATLNGDITDVGEDNVTQIGFDWGLTTYYGNSWTESGSFGTGTFSHGITGLTGGTTYHLRAKAYNSNGWGYGSDMTFTTLDSPSLPEAYMITSFFGPTGDERLGTYVAAGDINGDGYPDIIAGGRRNSSRNYGVVRIYMKGSGMVSGMNDAQLGPGGYKDYFFRVAAGDINNDGKDDVIVGAYGEPSGRGSVYIFLSTTITADFDRVLSPSQADYKLTGTNADDNFGHAVWVANVDGDSYDDVIVGAYKADYSGTDSGRVYIFKGDGMQTESSTNADWIITGGAQDDYFGYDVNEADIDNDGKDDVIVGAYGAGSEGKVYIFKGGGALSTLGSKTVSNADITIDGSDNPSNADSFGKAVSTAGDVDNDNREDIIIGALHYSSDKGRVYIFLGSSLTVNKNSGDADYIITGNSNGDFLGQDVSTAGDIDNNGYDDVIIGAAPPIGYSAAAGKAYIFMGNHLVAFMNASNRDYEFSGASGDVLGFSVGKLGDINDDGKSEWFIGAPLQDGCNNGRVYVYSLYNYNPPTYVEISSFVAKPLNSQVLVEWKTISELDSEGFNLLRREGEKDGYVQINPYFIPSKGEAGLGAEYRFMDYNVKNGETYYYLLENKDIYGEVTLYGPVSATPNDITLVWPRREGEIFSSDSSLFMWSSFAYSSFKIDISSTPNFTESAILSFPKEGWTSSQSLRLSRGEWEMVLSKARKNNGRLFWRVRAMSDDGNVVYSSSSEFFIEKLSLNRDNHKVRSPIRQRK